ncbi:hypothetical protein [Meiothermus sp.]|uniref:hypothetical protein n=1 Tax=Meiothermus sp. TaxID=1955249 RepID=UPI0021DD8929|nr:hypothetical protein [Meiothermus sp.]GIW33381.1 MAG: hypothetical protein KatS3mg072_0714 [Meiothermus sp.]
MGGGGADAGGLCALLTLTSVLKPDHFLVYYPPNLTQVVTLLEHLKILALPYLQERTLEVIHREWGVHSPSPSHTPSSNK